ncbi:hypothetical protein Sya03_36210 [Spirilliplanes yamanashiensis]|uniref:Uncharacterized protein n=1 Tax=Spirilliplanes yamanashiensis TaxID=42233 RepID=A0A8J3YAB8_9ACTN|nr:hypothetical protein Sya03_36210 [Spirilliplanes yamanashiensis]
MAAVQPPEPSRLKHGAVCISPNDARAAKAADVAAPVDRNAAPLVGAVATSATRAAASAVTTVVVNRRRWLSRLSTYTSGRAVSATEAPT